MSDGRLRWQCRRGMKELDALLLGFLDAHYETASADDKQAFEEVLALSDPQLVGYFLKGEKPPTAAMQRVVSRILD